MKKQSLICILFLLLLTGCVERYNPFKIEKSRLFIEIRTVGLLPVSIAVEVDNEEQVKKQFEDKVTAKLNACGFRVVPPQEYARIYEAFKKSIGPLYDPYTGKILEKKTEALAKYTRREYLSRYEVDALVHPAIVVVKANWNANVASWHGAKEPSTGRKGFRANMAVYNAYGNLPALSLRLSIFTAEDDIYYLNYGGIQLISWVTGRDFVPVPKEHLLSNWQRNADSVDIAFEPLLEKEKKSKRRNKK